MCYGVSFYKDAIIVSDYLQLLKLNFFSKMTFSRALLTKCNELIGVFRKLIQWRGVIFVPLLYYNNFSLFPLVMEII